MLKALIPILDIQELDMQMIQLMRLKSDRKKELHEINSVKENLRHQAVIKEGEIIEIKKNIRLVEGEVAEVNVHIKKLEAQQNAVKKVDEFNALTHEMAQTERERTSKEQRLSDLYDKLAIEEEILKTLTQTLDSTSENSKAIENEIQQSIQNINEEGRTLLAQREKLVKDVDQDVFKIYERLLRNKKDRVVVPIENRCCSGCHILLTAQDENLVRKGERLVFCEHCSRIHYWQESKALEGSTVATKQRRRRTTKV